MKPIPSNNLMTEDSSSLKVANSELKLEKFCKHVDIEYETHYHMIYKSKIDPRRPW